MSPMLLIVLMFFLMIFMMISARLNNFKLKHCLVHPKWPRPGTSKTQKFLLQPSQLQEGFAVGFSTTAWANTGRSCSVVQTLLPDCFTNIQVMDSGWMLLADKTESDCLWCEEI